MSKDGLRPARVFFSENNKIYFEVVCLFACRYGLITEDFKFQPYMMLFLGLTMLVMGLREFQKGQKGYGWLSIIVFIFILFVSIKSFLLK